MAALPRMEISNKEQFKQLVHQLLALYPNGHLKPVHLVSGGLSGASVLLVQAVGTPGHYSGLAFAKIDAQDRSERESRKHATARQGRIAPHLPAIIGDPIGPVGGWSMSLYQIAHNNKLKAQLLGEMVEHHMPASQIAEQVKRLTHTVLACWHDLDEMLAASQSLAVPDLFHALINVGEKDRFAELEARAQQYFDITRDNELLLFRPGNVLLPNPIAYVMNPDLWANIHPIVAPQTPIHGDLHGANVICRIEPTISDPQVIDLAQFEDSSIPFFDLAYLELDLILRCMPTNTRENWNDWLYITQHLTSSTLPVGDPSGIEPLFAWHIVQPIRAYLHTILTEVGQRSIGLEDQFEAAWWLSAVAVGVLMGRRSHTEKGNQRIGALLYAARALARLNGLLGVPASSQEGVKITFQPERKGGDAPFHPLSAPLTPVKPAPPPKDNESPACYVSYDLTPENIEDLGPALARVLTARSFTPYFGDQAIGGQSKLLRKWQRIYLSALCIFDISSRDHDVLIELGIALSLNRPTIIIVKAGEALPALLDESQVLRYASYMELRERLMVRITALSAPPADPVRNHCGLCNRVCEGMNMTPNSKVCLTLNSSKMAWHDFMDKMKPYLRDRDVQEIYLTDLPLTNKLCEVRRKVLACQLALCHPGTLSNENSFLALGMVIGNRAPWLVFHKTSDAQLVPPNLQGLDAIEYATLNNLGGQQNGTIDSFFDLVFPTSARPDERTSMLVMEPLWDDLKKWVDSIEAGKRPNESFKGKLHILHYEGQRLRSRSPILRHGLIIGRDPQFADVVLVNSQISQQHFRIVEGRDRRYYVEDLNSTNGTLLNGVQLVANQRAEVFVNDTIRVDGVGSSLVIWDERELPENTRATLPKTSLLSAKVIEIEIANLTPPRGGERLDYRRILQVMHPETRRELSIEVQSYYPLGAIVAALAKRENFPAERYHFVLKDQELDDRATLLTQTVADTDVLKIVRDDVAEAIRIARQKIDFCDKRGCQGEEHGKVVWRLGKPIGTVRVVIEGSYKSLTGNRLPSNTKLPMLSCPNCHTSLSETSIVGAKDNSKDNGDLRWVD